MITGKGRWNTSKDGQEVILESANGMLCCIAAIDLWWNKLVFATIVGDDLAKGGTGFIVHNVDDRSSIGHLKAG